jgi:hypothetical protein
LQWSEWGIPSSLGEICVFSNHTVAVLGEPCIESSGSSYGHGDRLPVAQDEVKEAMAEDGRPYPQGEEKGSRGVSRRGAVHEHYRHGEAGGGGAPSGTVKSSKTVGGHPVLMNAAMDAMKRWKCEPAPTESRGIVGIQVPTSGLDGEKKTRSKSEL